MIPEQGLHFSISSPTMAALAFSVAKAMARSEGNGNGLD